jgi:hypothetical protein
VELLRSADKMRLFGRHPELQALKGRQASVPARVTSPAAE